MSPVLLATTLLALAAGAPAKLPLPVAHRTSSVVIHTDIGSAWAKGVAREIESRRDALVAELGPLIGTRPKPRPLTLLAFRSSAAYRAFAAKASPAHVSALGWYDPGRALAVVHTDTTFATQHEASHWVLREVLDLPGREDLPVWVVEGIPCLAEAWSENGLSRYRMFRLDALRSTGFDPTTGWTATQADLGRGRDEELYAAGWVVARFLRERHRSAFRAYLTGVTPGKPLPDLAGLVGTTPEKLAGELRRHVESLPAVGREDTSRRFPALIPDAERPASDAEVFRQVEFLRHPDPAVQHVAMAWFSNHRHTAVVPTLLAAFGEESERFRLDACAQIARLDPKKAAPPLVDLLESKEPSIRLRAIRMLKKLNHRKDLGFFPHDDEATRAAAVARWRAWLEEFRPTTGLKRN